MIRRLWPFSRGSTASRPAPGTAQEMALSERGKDMAALEALLRGATPGTTIQLHDTFAGARLIPREHEWYYGAQCRWCHRTAAAIHDPNEGQTKVALSGSGKIRFHCPHCNGLLEVAPAQILWFQFDG